MTVERRIRPIINTEARAKSPSECPMTTDPSNLPEIEVVAETRFLRLVKRGNWSFAQRPSAVRVVAVVAVTDEEEVILVQQHRPPVGGDVIELPAGLAGDIAGEENESLETAARRELIEETGYTAKKWKELATVTSSAGMTDERVTIFLARGLVKESAGGGVDSENIVVHKIALDQLEPWLADAAQQGLDIDSRVYSALYWAKT